MVHGRGQEQAAIAAVVDEARAGRGGTLVVRGLPGVGKTALLDDAAQQAEEVLVLRTVGIESESPLAFAALHRLLRPLMQYADRLPEPQSLALRSAFGEVASAGVDRFLIFLAALSLLAEAAEHSPVLAVVDDAQWLDEVSAAALLFVARRLNAERVALVFGARDGDERRFDSGDLPEIGLAGLDEAAALVLLREQSGTAVPAHIAAELVRATGGNPLALVELARALTAAQLSGADRLPDHLPLTEGVERAFLERYQALPEDAQMWLLAAAADDGGDVATARQAAAALGTGDRALDALEQSGLLRLIDGKLQLRHPLVRSAVYGAATDYRRALVHRALAAALSGEAQADRRTWHLAAAAREPDEHIAAELDQVAGRARSRGGHEAAGAAWERAAELTADAAAKARRLHEAAESAWLTADTVRADRLNTAALALAHEPLLRADIALLRARIEWNTGSLQAGRHLVLEGAKEVAEADPVRARELAMFGAALGSFDLSRTGLNPLEIATEPGPAAPARQKCFWHLLAGFHHVRTGDLARGAALLRAAYADGASLDHADQDLLPNLGIAAVLLGDDQAALEYHGLLLSRARTGGALVMALYALTRRHITDVVTGNWAAARSGASEALQLANGSGQAGLTAFPLAALTLLDALQSEGSYARHVGAAEEVAAKQPLGSMHSLVHDVLLWAKAVESGEPEAAFHQLARLEHPVMRHTAAVDRVEAAFRSGHREEAAAWTGETQNYAAATGNAWAAAAAAHCEALLTEGEEAERLYFAALEHHASSPRVFDRARTQLAYGGYLRRARRRVDARRHLSAALETFTELGARPWEERAHQELRASGKTARKREPSAVVVLTPQERQVAALIQQGLSNRDAAAQLFLSPRTIDFHLRNVYAKLGISNRGELMRRQLDRASA